MILQVTYKYDTVEVDFDYYKGFAGNAEEPPEPAEIEINKVWYAGTNVSTIVDFEEIEQSLWKVIDFEDDRY